MTEPPAPPPDASYADPMLGQVIGDRYLLTRVIGTGGMGRVYEARHVVMKSRVAVKLLHPHLLEHREVVERFVLEAQAAGSLGHPHIARCVDAGRTADGVPFLALEYLEGDTVAAVLSRREPVAVERAVRIACEIAEALEAAHRQGIVHRDVKPGNILLARGQGDGAETAKLLDFGIAKVMDTTTQMTRTGSMLGSGHYTAPEQLRDTSRVGPEADIYALGIVLYELLTGERAWKGHDVMRVVAEIAQGEGPTLPSVRDRRPDVPAHVAAALSRALEREPSRRWRSAAEFAAALMDPGVMAEDLAAAAARRRRWIAPAAVAALALATASIWAALAWRGPETEARGATNPEAHTSPRNGGGPQLEPSVTTAAAPDDLAPPTAPTATSPSPLSDPAQGLPPTPDAGAAEVSRDREPVPVPRPRRARRAKPRQHPTTQPDLVMEGDVPLFRTNRK